MVKFGPWAFWKVTEKFWATPFIFVTCAVSSDAVPWSKVSQQFRQIPANPAWGMTVTDPGDIVCVEVVFTVREIWLVVPFCPIEESANWWLAKPSGSHCTHVGVVPTVTFAKYHVPCVTAALEPWLFIMTPVTFEPDTPWTTNISAGEYL